MLSVSVFTKHSFQRTAQELLVLIQQAKNIPLLSTQKEVALNNQNLKCIIKKNFSDIPAKKTLISGQFKQII
jgi:hypothetical protein